MLRMKNENKHNGSYTYIPASVFEFGKRKRKLDYPIPIFHMESEKEKRKDGIYNTWCFSVFHVFILQKKKQK